MKKWLYGALALLVVAALAFFALAPGMTERSMNKVVPVPLKITPQARALHARLQIADMHADTMLWNRDLLARSGRGQVDLPRLQDGNVALQIFSSVSKTPKGQNYDANSADSDNITMLAMAQLQPVRTWTSLLQRSLWHAAKLDRAAAASQGEFRVIRTAAELDALLAARARGQKIVGGMLSIEGLQDLEGKLSNLDTLYAAGFRMAGMAHFFDNEVAGSMHGEAKGGLTPLGRQVIARMEALGMVVDIAHASHATVAEILRIATRPVVASHGGVQATCAVNRNLTDAEIRGVAATGGVVGIGYWEAAICGTTPARVALVIAHVRDVAGIDHVGLGSDFDGAVTTGFDTGQLAAVTQALVDRGFSDGDVAKVMGTNVLRVLRAGIVPR
ncbi:dipeptidase [Sphingomonas hylomeconis]|uniref:Dipeptidase n=1 Tax=Sphingomonas hylomeconis TaxID=1395958 RepID=A0ABV7SRX0_9SPHN|nr:dipeptidase [Sphingomonas hylomeconis]